MKVLVNGGINLSELDGWWAEAYCPEVGWSLGDGMEHDADPGWDAFEAQELYRLLEEEIIPSFYQRDSRGVSRDWVRRMRVSMARLTPQFSTNRMLRQYVEELYVPAARRLRERTADSGRFGAVMQRWRRRIEAHWANIHFGNMEIEQKEGRLEFRVQVYLDDLEPDDLVVELYADPVGADLMPEIHAMDRSEKLSGAVNGFLYKVEISTDRAASDYTPRIRPWMKHVNIPLEEAHILWMK